MLTTPCVSERPLSLQVGVSLVLSFMIVWDLPTIQQGTASLRTSRLRSFYAEVAPTCTVFGTLFGKALQAQVGTALRCTLLFHWQQGLSA